MNSSLTPLSQMQKKYASLSPFLDERSRRLWCATEARAIGVGGISFVSKATGVSRPTIHKGLKEIDNPELCAQETIRPWKSGKSAIYADRDAQFQLINDKVKEFQARGAAVLSVDTKKKENIGNFKNNGQEWGAKGETVDVNVHDFKDKKLGKAAPYGVYDVSKNVGWVSVGISSDTAEFAVASIRNWWNEMGKEMYEGTRELMITADCGGSNGNGASLEV
jgi:hypothetical protein